MPGEGISHHDLLAAREVPGVQQTLCWVQATVHEALMFSARCRLSREHDNHTVLRFVQEVRSAHETCP